MAPSNPSLRVLRPVMDVVALLNASAANPTTRASHLGPVSAPDDLIVISTTEPAHLPSVSPVPDRESELIQTAPESRWHTPWDVGGYPLSLIFDTKPFHNRGTIVYNGSPIDNAALITYADVSSAADYAFR